VERTKSTKTQKRTEALGLTEEIIIDRLRNGQNSPSAILPTEAEQLRRVDGVVAYRVLDAMLQSMRRRGKIRFSHALGWEVVEEKPHAPR
jgi:hypothetical protein